VQATPLSELRQGLGVRRGEAKFGGVEHFIRGVREIRGGLTPSVNPPMQGNEGKGRSKDFHLRDVHCP
jgi:hypothetical protein